MYQVLVHILAMVSVHMLAQLNVNHCLATAERFTNQARVLDPTSWCIAF